MLSDDKDAAVLLFNVFREGFQIARQPSAVSLLAENPGTIPDICGSYTGE